MSEGNLEDKSKFYLVACLEVHTIWSREVLAADQIQNPRCLQSSLYVKQEESLQRNFGLNHEISRTKGRMHCHEDSTKSIFLLLVKLPLKYHQPLGKACLSDQQRYKALISHAFIDKMFYQRFILLRKTVVRLLN